MKNFTVTLSHIVGYYPADKDGNSEPKLKLTDVIVSAETEYKAIKKATNEDKTHWSIYESYACETED